MKPLILLVVDQPLRRLVPRHHEIADLVVIDMPCEPLLASSEEFGDALMGAFPGAQLDAADGPRWNTLMPRGKWHGANLASVGGSIDLTDAYFSEMIANWKAAGSPRLPIRKTHLHLQKDDPELQASYGALTDFRIGASGLETLTDWTENGRGEVRSGRFTAWSPEWYPTHVDRRTGERKGAWMSGTALTNDPFFISMPPVAAAALPTNNPQHNEGNTMNEAELNQLRASLGLAANTPVADVLKAASKAGAAITASATNPDNSALIASVKAQDEKLTALVAANAKKDEQLTALTASLLEKDVDALVATAKKGDGKNGRAITEKHVLRAKKIAKEEGLTASAEFLNEIALTVPMQATGVQGTGEPLTAAAAGKQLMDRAAELRAKGDPSAMVSAMREMPEVALIAEGRPTSSN